MEFLNKGIIAIGSTSEFGGTIILINGKDINNDQAKCATFDTESKTVHLHDNIQKVIKFNPFDQVKDKLTSDSYILQANRSLPDSGVKSVNDHLVAS